MKAVIQRVAHASVVVDGATVGSCKAGYMILLGVAEGDTEQDAELLCKKIANLRIFPDAEGKMNLSVKDIDGEVLVVSNFTLNANYAHGNRPDYLASASPDVADRLYMHFVGEMRSRVRSCKTGVFGAHMVTEMSTDGPVTIVMDSKVLLKKGHKS